MSWKSTSTTKPCLLLRDQAPRSKLGQDPHLSPTPQASLRKKLTSCVALLRRFAGSGWSSGATTLRTVTLILVYLTAEYCTPAWCRSAHTRLIDVVINDALWILTGCLRPTPADNLLILVGIQPAEFRRKGATLSRASSTMEPGPWAAWGPRVAKSFQRGAKSFQLCPIFSNYAQRIFPGAAKIFAWGITLLALPCNPLEPSALPGYGFACSLDICSTQLLTVPRVRMHGISNLDTHLYPLHNNSSVHITTATTEVRVSGKITDGMRSSSSTLPESALSSPTSAHTLLEWLSQEHRGSCLTTFAPVSGVSLLLTQKGHRLFCILWVWRKGTDGWPCCLPLSYPSTSPWSVWSDNSW